MKIKHTKQKILLCVVSTLLAFIVGDFLFGRLKGIVHVRWEALQFYTEAGEMSIRTKTLIPSLFHEYEEPWRPEGEKYFARSEMRVFRTDEHGFVLGPDGEKSYVAGIRILFSGDSMTEALEVDEPYRFPYLVGDLLRRRGMTEVRTFNYGVRAHTTQDCLNLLLNHRAHRSVHLMLIMFNVNDREFLAYQGDYLAAPTQIHRLSFGKFKQVAGDVMSGIGRWFYYHSNIVFALRSFHRAGHQNTMPGKARKHTDVSPEEHRNLFKTNLELIVATCRSLDIRPVLLTQPIGFASDGQQQFNETIIEVAMEQGADFIDVDREFAVDRRAFFFPDMIHLNNEGSILTAQIIADSLAGILQTAMETNREISSGNRHLVVKKLLSSAGSVPSSAFPTGDRIPVRHLIVPGQARYPTFSSDGKKLLFQRIVEGHSHVCVRDLDTGEEVHLTAGAKQYMHPTFLETSGKVLCTREDDGKMQLVILDDNVGTRPFLVEETTGLSCRIPCYDRNNNSIFFAGHLSAAKKGREPAPPDLYRYNRTTCKLDRITKTPWEEWRPVTTSDGAQLLFISNQSGNFDIYKKRLDSKDSVVSVIYKSPADEWDPCLSPDDRWMVFATKQVGNWDLMLMDLSSAKVKRITDHPDDEYDPSFHPSGKLIIFSVGSQMNPGIYAISPFGER